TYQKMNNSPASRATSSLQRFDLLFFFPFPLILCFTLAPVPTNCRAPLACWQGRQGELMPLLSAQPLLAIIVTCNVYFLFVTCNEKRARHDQR
ncbi:hypothetical protein, partial [Aeromonas caviae]